MHPNMLARPIIAAAKRRSTITYGELAEAVGGIARGLGPSLARLETWCADNSLPPLTVSVVRQDSGRSGDDGRYRNKRYSDMSDADIKALQQRVFDHDWSQYGRVFGD